MMINEDDHVPISSLNHYAFCPHRCWRMFSAGEFVDNQYTIEGTTLHERVHTMGENIRDDILQVRSIWLKSDKYRLIGKSDLIECVDGRFFPIEYKRGKRGEWDNDELQVCAQALCLEELTGQSIGQGYVYYALSHQRQLVEISDDLRQFTINTIDQVFKILMGDFKPLPVYAPKCKGCSLVKQCLPRLADKVRSYRE
jgi:CRISPR-associated exonuclease Cas4